MTDHSPAMAALVKAEARRNTDQARSLCRHDGETVERTAHGYLGDYPRGTVQTLCVECGAELDDPAPLGPMTFRDAACRAYLGASA